MQLSQPLHVALAVVEVKETAVAQVKKGWLVIKNILKKPNDKDGQAA